MLEGQIYNQIFKKDEVKTELSSEGLELSVVKGLQLINEAKSKVNAAANDIVSGMRQIDNNLVKIKNAEKDLDIDLSKEFKAVKRTWEKAKQAQKAAESLISDLASI